MTKTSEPGAQSAAQAAARRDAQSGTRRVRRVKRGLAFAGLALFLQILLMTNAPSAFAQALPAAEASPISTGFSLPGSAGTLRYAVTAAETLSWGYNGDSGVDTATNLTGDIAYLSNSKDYPFSMIFSGGRGWSTSGQPSYSFLNLGLSQVILKSRWSFVVSDNASYLPETPSIGLSGVPGVGDIGVPPTQVGTDTGQGVLTNYATRVFNSASASISRQITGKTSISANGSYGLTRFVGDSAANNGLNSDQETGGGSLSHRIDARNTISGNYAYSTYTYADYDDSSYTYGSSQPRFISQTASLQYSHQVTRKLGVTVSAGPQWTKIDTAGTTATLGVFASASANYTGRFSRVTLAYTRGTNGGYGVLGGALSNTVSFLASRTFARVWNCAASASYTQTASLPGTGVIPYSFRTVVAGGQASRALGRSFSMFASYTLERQTNQSAAVAENVFTGTSQFVGIGLTFSPTSIHLGRQ